jgi:hypothetical protein
MRPCDQGSTLAALREMACSASVDLSLLTEHWMDDVRTVEQRIPDVYQWLRQNIKHGQDVLLVTHNGVLRRVMGLVDAPHCQAHRCTPLNNLDDESAQEILHAGCESTRTS